MSSSVVLIPPITYIPLYGGGFRNGTIVGYGAIRNNINKINLQGYFTDGVLSNAPIMSTYIEWTTAPEQVMMVLGNFVSGKVDGIVYNYQSTGSIYCRTDENKSNVIARTRYILANKVQQTCTAGTVDSSTSMGVVTLMMNWVNNNLLTAFDIGNVSLAAGFEVDDAVRADSNYVMAVVKNSFTNSIYN